MTTRCPPLGIISSIALEDGQPSQSKVPSWISFLFHVHCNPLAAATEGSIIGNLWLGLDSSIELAFDSHQDVLLR